jgi:hypothetical protein
MFFSISDSCFLLFVKGFQHLHIRESRGESNLFASNALAMLFQQATPEIGRDGNGMQCMPVCRAIPKPVLG